MERLVRVASCTCGRVRCEGVGQPILSAVCYCDDCQTGARQIGQLSNAPTVLDEDGGTAYLTYRDDRFRCVQGADLLVGFKLRDRASTQRFVASCCNTAMFLKFAPGHWVSAYRRNFQGDVPRIAMRTQTRFRQSEVPMPDDAPSYRRFPVKLFAKLIAARWQMFVRR